MLMCSYKLVFLFCFTKLLTKWVKQKDYIIGREKQYCRHVRVDAPLWRWPPAYTHTICVMINVPLQTISGGPRRKWRSSQSAVINCKARIYLGQRSVRTSFGRPWFIKPSTSSSPWMKLLVIYWTPYTSILCK